MNTHELITEIKALREIKEKHARIIRDTEKQIESLMNRLARIDK